MAGACVVSSRDSKTRIAGEQNVSGRECVMKLERLFSLHSQGLDPALKILLIIVGSLGNYQRILSRSIVRSHRSY